MTAEPTRAVIDDDERESLARAAVWAGITVREVTQPRSQHVVLGDLRFHYLDWGDASPRPVVFVHGSGLTAHTWDLVALGLSQGRRCLSLDLRGHGDSEWSPGLYYGIDDHAADVEAFLDLVGGRPVLVGMSLGALVAARVAARTDQLSGLVMVDMSPAVMESWSADPTDDSVAGTRQIGRFLADAPELDSFDEFVERALTFNPRRNRAALQASLRHSLRQLSDGRWTWKYDPRPYQRTQPRESPPTAADLWADVGSVSVPAMVVRGADSRVLSQTAGLELSQTFAVGSFAEIPNAGHTCHSDNPAAFLSAMESFLAAAGIA